MIRAACTRTAHAGYGVALGAVLVLVLALCLVAPEAAFALGHVTETEELTKGEMAISTGEILSMLVVGLVVIAGGTAVFIAIRARRPAPEPEDDLIE